MYTQSTITDPQTAPMAAGVYNVRDRAAAELDALLAAENAEIQAMQIAGAEDLAELERLISPNAMRELEVLGDADAWLLAS